MNKMHRNMINKLIMIGKKMKYNLSTFPRIKMHKKDWLKRIYITCFYMYMHNVYEFSIQICFKTEIR